MLRLPILVLAAEKKRKGWTAFGAILLGLVVLGVTGQYKGTNGKSSE